MNRVLRDDLRRFLPVWAAACATALAVALFVKDGARSQLLQAAAEDGNPCTMAAIRAAAGGMKLEAMIAEAGRKRTGRAENEVLGRFRGDPRIAAARADLEEAAAACPQLERAFDDLGLVEWLDGNEAASWRRIGDARAAGRRFPEAEVAYAIALGKEPADSASLLGWTLALSQQGRAAEARARIAGREEELAKLPGGAIPIGRLMAAVGDFPRAESFLRRGVAEKPADIYAVRDLSHSFRMQKKFEEGARFMEQAAAAGRTLVDTWAAAAYLWRDAGDLPREERALARAAELAPRNRGIAWDYALCLHKQGKQLAARDAFRRAKEIDRTFTEQKMREAGIAE